MVCPRTANGPDFQKLAGQKATASEDRVQQQE
jgi:hypothetical protein